MSEFQKYLDEQLKDLVLKAEWDRQAPMRELVNQIIEARVAQGLSQRELAARCGMKPSNLCRIETGNANPSLRTVARIAQGLGKHLEIKLV